MVDDNLYTLCASLNLFLKTNPAEIYNFIVKNKSWPLIKRSKKKHRALDHYKNSSSSAAENNKNFRPPLPPSSGWSRVRFRKRWQGKSGIYKITFLPFRLFTYIGSSKYLGARFKFHRYMTPKVDTFLGYFLRTFGWDYFSITVVEEVSLECLIERENFYLDKLMPLLNIQTRSNTYPSLSNLSPIIRLKISKALSGKTHSSATRLKMSLSRTGENNYWFGKSLPAVILDAAAAVNGKKVYAYDAETFSQVNYIPFRSLRSTVKSLPISFNKLSLIIDTGKAHKGYYYFSTSQSSKPN